MSSAFSPDGSEPLGRTLVKKSLRPESIALEQFYRLPEVTRFLIGYEGFVALQFPDSMLSDATRIVEKLENECVDCQFCIVGDSTYGEGDVDEVNARHLDNQRIVLFGDANCKQKTTIKSLFIRYVSYFPHVRKFI